VKKWCSLKIKSLDVKSKEVAEKMGGMMLMVINLIITVLITHEPQW